MFISIMIELANSNMADSPPLAMLVVVNDVSVLAYFVCNGSSVTSWFLINYSLRYCRDVAPDSRRELEN